MRIKLQVAEGSLAIEPLELLYLVTNEYDASDELGFAWDDGRAAVPWPAVAAPAGQPILSDRDLANPSLTDLVLTLELDIRSQSGPAAS